MALYVFMLFFMTFVNTQALEVKSTADYGLVLRLAEHPRMVYSRSAPGVEPPPGPGVEPPPGPGVEPLTERLTSPSCALDIGRVIADLDSELYALNMLDSIGKPGSGILQGNIRWFGNFDQCKGVQAINNSTKQVDFTGQYCLATIEILTIGLCVPDSCNETDVETLMNQFLGSIGGGTIVTDVHCVHPIPWRTGDTVMVVIIGIFAMLVLCSTAYEIYVTKKPKKEKYKSDMSFTNQATNVNANNNTDVELTHFSGGSAGGDNKNPTGVSARGEKQDPTGVTTSSATLVQLPRKDPSVSRTDMKHQMLTSFSLMSNCSKLISMRSTPAGMESLNGLRVISMAWVILGHSFSSLSLFINNGLVVMETLPNRFSFQFVLKGHISVDTFFFLSGFLVAFGTLKILNKTKGRMNWALFYIARFLRLTPVYMFVLFFYVTITPHLISGPYESEEMTSFAYSPCHKYWWTNLLYINNFYPDNAREACISWTWYLANDMQFYLVSPLFIYTLYRKRKVGYVCIVLGILSNFLAVGIIANKYELGNMHSTIDPAVWQQYENNVYQRPYYRIAPYLIGVLCADLYMRTKDKVRSMKATWWKVLVVVLWVLSLGMMQALLYGLYPYEKDGQDAYITPEWLHEFYLATHRFVWALCIAWVSLACLTGWGGFVNRLLSWGVWEPLVRLCFLMYLLHSMVMAVFLFNLKQTVYIHEWIAAFWFIGFLVSSCAASVVFFLLVEQPLGRIQRVLLKK